MTDHSRRVDADGRAETASLPGDQARPGRKRPGNGAPVRVLIVDDHKLFAEGVRPALARAGLRVLDPAADAQEALDAMAANPPDLVLVDLGLPDMDGVELGKMILRRWPDARVVAVTAMRDARVVRDALKAGFHGYLTKDMPLPQFLQSVLAIIDGQVVIPHPLAAGAAGARSPQEEHADLVRSRLTPREYQVLALLVDGHSTKEMARLLTLSPNTVRTHVQNILEKLQVGSRLEAVAFAARHHLVARPGHAP